VLWRFFGVAVQDYHVASVARDDAGRELQVCVCVCVTVCVSVCARGGDGVSSVCVRARPCNCRVCGSMRACMRARVRACRESESARAHALRMQACMRGARVCKRACVLCVLCVLCARARAWKWTCVRAYAVRWRPEATWRHAKRWAALALCA
jgi:hypothetical protein